MSDAWKNMEKAKEDAYFDRANKEALERLKKTTANRASPATGKPLEKKVIEGVVVDYCSDSAGIWLERQDIEQLFRADESHPGSARRFFKTVLGF
jgi:Transcription factor zinc-finger/Mitochondrial ATPase inhibitor, IATP